METRIICTELWRDSKFRALDDKEARILLFLLTNDRMLVLPAYKIALDEVAFYCGTSVNKIEETIPKLKDFGVYYVDKHFVVTDKFTRAKYTGGKTERKRERIWNAYPDSIKEIMDTEGEFCEHIAQSLANHCPTIGHINHKSEIKNQKKKDKKKNTKKKNRKKDGVPIGEFIDGFNKLFGRNYRVTDKRRKKLKVRLETFSFDEIKQATVNLSKSDWHRGENDSGWRADPDFILRNDEQVDKWLNKNKESPKKSLLEELEGGEENANTS